MKKHWNLKISTKYAGRIAEFLCRMYMRFRGYRIIAKNYICGTGKKTPFGELDFVAIKGKHIVFCEVKKRQHNEDFLKALSYNQQQRIMRGGQYFISRHPKYKNHTIQFDVFFVKLPWHIERIKNAFYAN
ncbi:MAG: YraN family protein [Acetobacter sp.]|nr:YraN family protein [Acetobacter sp.]